VKVRLSDFLKGWVQGRTHPPNWTAFLYYHKVHKGTRRKTFVLFVAFVVIFSNNISLCRDPIGALISLREAGNRSAPYTYVLIIQMVDHLIIRRVRSVLLRTNL